MTEFKLGFALLFLCSATQAGTLRKIDCTTATNNLGITHVVALETANNQVVSEVTKTNASGTPSTLPKYSDEGTMGKEYQILPGDGGVFGIVQTFLVVDLTQSPIQFHLSVRTYCNFYYQEETCGTGELLDSTDTPAQCTISNQN